MTNTFKWGLTVVIPVAAWLAFTFVCLCVYKALEITCPPSLVESEMCTAWWFRYAEWVFYFVAPPASAVVVVLCAFITAPSSRLTAAWGALGGGTLAALVMAGGNVFWFPFFSSVVAGLLTALAITRWHGATQLGIQEGRANARPLI